MACTVAPDDSLLVRKVILRSGRITPVAGFTDRSGRLSAAAAASGHRSHHNSRLVVTVDGDAGVADKPIPTIIISDYARRSPRPATKR